ncbi:helix-turn-helix transcriptional regulator [Paenibacillus sp. MBLB4367]|uniref:helix-turn-helix transcriptional regulator n=1 Tax=Paenibacillus sp. MBLB4367 TaxID=3384767 RepID=UPI0039080211
MSKADNMLSILWLLKTEKRMTGKQLADALEINIRTVYRYIDALCASGVPIVSDAGHNGGYSLLGTFMEAPLFFDMNEQKALVHAAIFAQESGYPFGDALAQAIAKLKMYTNQEQLERINRHAAGFDVIGPPPDGSEAPILQELEAAVADSHTIGIDYQKGYGAQTFERRIDPYGIVLWKGKWYVVGHCHLRLDIRSFRVDRIRRLTRTDSVFERPAGFSARQVFMANIIPETDKPDQLVTMRIRGKRQAIDDLCGHWLFGQLLQERDAESAVFKLEKNMMLHYVPHLLMTYRQSIQVLEPDALKERLVAAAADLLTHYKNMQLS